MRENINNTISATLRCVLTNPTGSDSHWQPVYRGEGQQVLEAFPARHPGLNAIQEITVQRPGEKKVLDG